MRIWIRRNRGIRPKWYYGHAYFDFDKDANVMAIVPLNFLWKWWRRIEHWWFSGTCCGRSWVDEHVEKQVEAIRKRNDI